MFLNSNSVVTVLHLIVVFGTAFFLVFLLRLQVKFEQYIYKVYIYMNPSKGHLCSIQKINEINLE